MSPADDLPTVTLNNNPSTNGTPTPPAGSTAEASPLPSTLSQNPVADHEGWVTEMSGGRYRRAVQHKSGGLGDVFKAEDALLGRPVALKRLRADPRSLGLRERFLREARVTGRLEHPNIVPVYDLIESDDPVYAMRFLPGDTLADAVKSYHARSKVGAASPLELRKLLEAFVLVCEAMAYAHSRGVLHRDLKGQNILFGHFGEVCLADWGLAKRTDEAERPGDPHPLDPPLDGVTVDGAILGTPAFMAPEVARKQPATEKSDVYGLGAVLYQVLTGRGPHTGSNGEILSKLETGVPVKPVRELVASVHPALDAVCRKALSYYPADRYPTATTLADEVRAYLAGEPVAAYPEPFTARVARWARQHKAGVLAGVIGLAVLAVASSVAAGLVWRAYAQTAAANQKLEEQRQRTEEQRLAAEAARMEEEKAKKRAEDNYSIAWGLVASLSDLITRNETGLNRSTPEDRAKMLVGAVTAAEGLLKVRPHDTGEMSRAALLLRFTGRLAGQMNNDTTAEHALMRSVALQEQVLVLQPNTIVKANLALTLQDAGTQAASTGRLSLALDRLNRAATLLHSLSPAEAAKTDVQRAYGLVLLERASTEYWLGQFLSAAVTANQAADLFAKLATLPEPYFFDQSYSGMARTVEARSRRELARVASEPDYSVATTTYFRAVADLRTAVNREPSQDARHNLYRGLVDQAHVRFRDGKPLSGVADTLGEAVSGWRELVRANPRLPMYREWLAYGLIARGELHARAGGGQIGRSLAAADYREAASLLRPLLKDRPQDGGYWAGFATVWDGLARLFQATDRITAARYYHQAWKAYEEALAHDSENRVVAARRDSMLAVARHAKIDPTQTPPRGGR